MQRKPIDKALFLGVPVFLLALFILNITAEGEVKLAATLGSVGLCIGFFSYLRSRRFGNRYPIERKYNLSRWNYFQCTSDGI